MLLHGSPFSPFVRKVLVLAHETGLADRIEHRHATMTPVSPDAAVIGDNPLGKVPALVTDDAGVLYDSRVVCEYLDGLHGGRPLFPAAGPARAVALRRQALADGLMDAAVLVRYETTVRPEERRWPEWIAGQKAKIGRALDALEAEVPSLGQGFDIGNLAIACGLGYLDFRFSADAWRDRRAALADWFAPIAERPSMVATRPDAA